MGYMSDPAEQFLIKDTVHQEGRVERWSSFLRDSKPATRGAEWCGLLLSRIGLHWDCMAVFRKGAC